MENKEVDQYLWSIVSIWKLDGKKNQFSSYQHIENVVIAIYWKTIKYNVIWTLDTGLS